MSDETKKRAYSGTVNVDIEMTDDQNNEKRKNQAIV